MAHMPRDRATSVDGTRGCCVLLGYNGDCELSHAHRFDGISGVEDLLDLLVILATYNRAESLCRTLESFARADRRDLDLQVLVVDNNSTDSTRSVVDRITDRLPVRYLLEPQAGKSRALNRALDARIPARCVMFTDDDVEVEEEAFRSILQALERWPEHSVFGGRVLMAWPSERVARWATTLYEEQKAFPHLDFGDTEGLFPAGRYPIGPNFWVRGAALTDDFRFDESVGPPPARPIMGEDTSFLISLEKAGHDIVYIPTVTVRHHLQPRYLEPRNALKRAVASGRGGARLSYARMGRIASVPPLLWYPLRAMSLLRWALLYLRSKLSFSEDERMIRAWVPLQALAYNLEMLRIARDREDAALPPVDSDPFRFSASPLTDIAEREATMKPRKLGIVAVYMLDENNDWLLDLHFRQIEQHTESPYTVYACINDLSPALHARIRGNPRVRIVPCEPYRAGSGLLRQDQELVARKGLTAADAKYEHSWYLEQLIRAAVDDGVSHVAVFHADSFPVLSRWDITMIARLSDRCPLAGVTRDIEFDRKPLTAGMLFTREFYLEHHPRLLLNQEELDSADYRRFKESCPHVTDSGYGYAFRMFLDGLEWQPLAKTSPDRGRPSIASIYGDVFFHLHAAAFVAKTGTLGFTAPLSSRRGVGRAAARTVRALVPATMQRWVRSVLTPHVRARVESKDLDTWERERQLLYRDPGRFIAGLRREDLTSPS
jgi:GT2 family glycosyltransferase